MATTGDTPKATPAAPPKAALRGSSPLRDALNPPNLITLSRLVLAVILFVLIYVQGFWLTAAAVFVIAAATDFLDGYIARRYGLVTVTGRILDPFVDKIVVCGAFIFLLEKKVAVSGGDAVVWSGVNAWMVVIVVGREMFVSSLRGVLEQQGKDFSATWTGKAKMVLQCIAVTASLLSLAPQFREPDRFALATEFVLARDALLWLAVGFTAYSGIAYSWRAVVLLREESNTQSPEVS